MHPEWLRCCAPSVPSYASSLAPCPSGASPLGLMVGLLPLADSRLAARGLAARGLAARGSRTRGSRTRGDRVRGILICYRAPTLEDVESLASLGRRTFVETFGHLYAKADLHAYLEMNHTPLVIESALGCSDLTYWVAAIGGELVGYCKVGRSVTLPWEAPPGRVPMELRQLYVLRTHHGTGIAHELMNWALEQFASTGADDVLLSVFSENFRAQRFYSRYGFQRVGSFKFLVGKHEDEEYLFHRALR